MDDLEDLHREPPSKSGYQTGYPDSSSVPVQLFGSSDLTKKKKTKKNTEKVSKKEKKEKKKKKKKDNDHNDEKATEEILVVNGENTANDANVDDLDFWLSPSKKPEVKSGFTSGQLPEVKSTSGPKEEITKPKKSKKKKKSKEVDSSHQIIQTNGIGKKLALKSMTSSL